MLALKLDALETNMPYSLCVCCARDDLYTEVYWENVNKLVETMKKLEVEMSKKYAALMQAPETNERTRLLNELEDCCLLLLHKALKCTFVP